MSNGKADKAEQNYYELLREMRALAMDIKKRSENIADAIVGGSMPDDSKETGEAKKYETLKQIAEDINRAIISSYQTLGTVFNHIGDAK